MVVGVWDDWERVVFPPNCQAFWSRNSGQATARKRQRHSALRSVIPHGTMRVERKRLQTTISRWSGLHFRRSKPSRIAASSITRYVYWRLFVKRTRSMFWFTHEEFMSQGFFLCVIVMITMARVNRNGGTNMASDGELGSIGSDLRTRSDMFVWAAL